MDFWTYSKYGAKNVRVTLYNGDVYSGFICAHKFYQEEKCPIKISEFSIINNEYERFIIKTAELKEIELI